jgi:outer membrane lipoprotein SlyB
MAGIARGFAIALIAMPICPKCGVGYLESEAHRCPQKSQSLVGGVAGAITGGTLGFMVGGILFGFPLGLVIGAIVGARAGRS